MDIVIGYQNKEHVTAEQLGRAIAGLAGDGTYLLATQNGLAASMQTANQVRIDTGDLIAQGRVLTVETPETLTVESGVTGEKRNDLVVARYEKDPSSNVESAELVVVKGTPVSYGDPSDPSVNEGSILDGDSPVDVPLYRIPIDGLAPGTPERLIESTPSITDLRDSVSRSAQYNIGGNGGVEITPERDCDIFVIAARSNTWGFAGGYVALSIDSSQLQASSKHIGAISNGDTVGRELIAWAVFTGAKKGNNYQFSEVYTGQPQGDGNRTMFAVCL